MRQRRVFSLVLGHIRHSTLLLGQERVPDLVLNLKCVSATLKKTVLNVRPKRAFLNPAFFLLVAARLC